LPVIEAESNYRHDDRNASLKLISWFDLDAVRQAKVLVIGAGAIGNEVLKNLALMSIGHIYIVDLDTIEISNLSRSVLYRASDNGKKKAQAAAQALRQLNPECQVYWRAGEIEADLGEGFIRQFDVVLGCLDNLYARYVLNRRCIRAGVAWIDSGIATLDGQVQAFYPGEGGCYECGFGDAHYEVALGRTANSCNAIAAEAIKVGRSPTTVMIASVVAGIQVQECLKLLNRNDWGERTLVGKKLEYSGTNASVEVYKTTEREDCPAHEFEIDWDENPPLKLIHASAHMFLPEFLKLVSKELDHEMSLALDSEFSIGYSCPQCLTEVRHVRALHKIKGKEYGCRCGWIPTYQNELSTLNRISMELAIERFSQTPLVEFDIPFGGVVEVHGPNLLTKYVLLAKDMDESINYWKQESKMNE
jgi:molybdopterin/thiamine biosynthesis adenylyltransferase